CSTHTATTRAQQETTETVSPPSSTSELAPERSERERRLGRDLAAAVQAKNFAAVRSISSEMIALAREREGPGSLAEASGLYILGGAAFQQGDFAEAEQTATKALTICDQQDSAGHLTLTDAPICLGIANLLATSLFSQKRYQESSEVLRAML